MADEAVVHSSLQIQASSGTLNYRSNPSAFIADVDGSKGPTPGAITVAITGTSISLAELTTPGFCRVQNLDDTDSTNYVLLGIYDGASFFPLMELLPGEFFVFRLWREFGSEFVGTGTPADNNVLRAMAVGGAVDLLVEAFER